VITYLDQLERDLVAAIDRREVGRSAGRAWRRRAPAVRLDLAAVAAIAVIALGLATVALLRPATNDQRAVQVPAPAPTTPSPPTVIGPRTPLRLVGALTQTSATTWSGDARGPGGSGTMTLSGTVHLTPAGCCTTPRTAPRDARHVVFFRWAASYGTLRGCVDTTIYRRPHGRWVWDGGRGRVTDATGALRRYAGRGMGIAAETKTSAPDQARIILSGAGVGHDAGC
jgi:hypothetical protein